MLWNLCSNRAHFFAKGRLCCHAIGKEFLSEVGQKPNPRSDIARVQNRVVTYWHSTESGCWLILITAAKDEREDASVLERGNI